MKIKAQYAMVLNLDKCIGCHTCSLPCKNVWTNRTGAEYMWFNNVESKPGIGYPKQWEDQRRHQGGWRLNGRLRLRAGGRLHKSFNIFHNPHLPLIDEYYEPWTYDYGKLIDTPQRAHQPSIRPRSLLTGEYMRIKWGPNWEDDLAGIGETAHGDVNFAGLDYRLFLHFRNVFLFYLPRLCEHCLNPACVASCPSGALYKREEDGIVLVDQERCRGWRYCVTGCPYKKVYFNWKSGRAEKCLFCYPRVEAGLTPLCAHSCVGRIRYVGLVLYDLDRVQAAASARADSEVYPAHLDMLLDPRDAQVQSLARDQGLAPATLAAAERSPIYPLARTWKLALPLHPEFRTLPMVWYIPPLSPVTRSAEGREAELIDALRIPIAYLANLLTAGDPQPVRLALKRLSALRHYMRARRMGTDPQRDIAAEVGLSEADLLHMYRLLSLAPLEERFVLPTAALKAAEPYGAQGRIGFAG